MATLTVLQSIAFREAFLELAARFDRDTGHRTLAVFDGGLNVSARIAAGAHPVAVVVLMALGAPFAALFVIIHGAGNGLLTITRGTLPLALFGPVGYGQRQGFVTAPARASQAFAPLLFGLLLDDYGAASLWLTALLGVAAVVALFMMRVRQ